MKAKPKEVLVNLPAVHLLSSEDEVSSLAAAVNTFIHGKVKIKCEVLGLLGGQTVGLFYLQRNGESQDMRDRFMEMINTEEMSQDPVSEPLVSWNSPKSEPPVAPVSQTRLMDPFDS